MVKLVIVSNRLHITVSKREGRLQYHESIGGLATALATCNTLSECLWVGWPGISIERLKPREREIIQQDLKKSNCYPVFLPQRAIDDYYYGFSNKTIWPLFHYFLTYTIHNPIFWKAYKSVNKAFAKVVTKVADKESVIWIHDYHLMLLPKYIRSSLPETTIGYFHHIPFPSYEVFRTLPWRKEILEGLMNADLIGFHTFDYVWHFLDSISHVLGYSHQMGYINTGRRIVKVDAFPIGIDYYKFTNALMNEKVKKDINKFKKGVGDRKIILSIDRLDYTKGILNRLEAFDRFLEKYPQYREKVTLILVAVPSREGIEHYMELKRQLNEKVGRVNGKHGTIGWVPVWYLYKKQPFHTLVALYSMADIALITPLRDGMNLIAKEYIATKTGGKGVLILSEFAGASKEMVEALVVNPNDIDGMAETIKHALEMPLKEQIRRNRSMQIRLKRYNVNRWASDFLEKLSDIKRRQMDYKAKEINIEITNEICNNYTKANHRLIFLDYDGTLVNFAEKPKRAKPDYGIVKILRALTSQKKNEVVIISGRDREILERWFGKYDIGLIAEHGIWIKEKDNDWNLVEPLDSRWKDQIRPILEVYTDRTPGSFIEEKEFSLVWHYRQVDPKFAMIRVNELKDALRHLTENLGVGVFEGNKVIELKYRGINKGKAAMVWLNKRKWDFIMAIGDDRTDEDLFEVMNPIAYTIKVGLGPSNAKYRIKSVGDVRALLKRMLVMENEMS